MKNKIIEILNSGTDEFPFYQIMVDGKEYCATDSIEKAEQLKSFVGSLYSGGLEQQPGVSEIDKYKIEHWYSNLVYQLNDLDNAYADIVVFEEDKELFLSLLQSNPTPEISEVSTYINERIKSLEEQMKDPEIIDQKRIECKLEAYKEMQSYHPQPINEVRIEELANEYSKGHYTDAESIKQAYDDYYIGFTDAIKESNQ